FVNNRPRKVIGYKMPSMYNYSSCSVLLEGCGEEENSDKIITKIINLSMILDNLAVSCFKEYK
ncbi:MAG: hypothetical protein Athens071416_308, partial [Parcubacteria group bacterium Athens0714_16]